jgi:hypothetical protein
MTPYSVCIILKIIETERKRKHNLFITPKEINLLRNITFETYIVQIAARQDLQNCQVSLLDFQP